MWDKCDFLIARVGHEPEHRYMEEENPEAIVVIPQPRLLQSVLCESIRCLQRGSVQHVSLGGAPLTALRFLLVWVSLNQVSPMTEYIDAPTRRLPVRSIRSLLYANA